MHQDLISARTRSPDVLREHSPLPDGCNSPRTKIARKLDCLELDHNDASHKDWTHSPRKRTRLSSEEMADEYDTSVLSTEDHTLSAAQHNYHESDANAAAHIKALSGDGNSTALHRQSRISHFLQSTKPRRLRSPPPSVSNDSIEVTNSDHKLSATTTWQDSEITGMTVDFAAGDDGEGINGIAFRPSPQVAYARRQRRKQQVSEWRAREAREARVRRLERRSGCKIESRREKDRLVRFLDPGS